MIYVSLVQTQRDELMHCSHQAIGRVALRAQMILLSDRGFTVQEIAAIHACGQDVVRTWLHRYEREGIAGLEDEPRSGRPPQDLLAGPIVDAQASQSPPCSGHVQTCWTVCLLTAFLAARFHLCLSCSPIRRLLHQAGWRWARPRLAPARKPDPQAEAKLAARASAQREAVQGRGHLLYLDESELHLLPLIREGVDEGATQARPHTWRQPPPCLLWRFGCRRLRTGFSSIRIASWRCILWPFSNGSRWLTPVVRCIWRSTRHQPIRPKWFKPG